MKRLVFLCYVCSLHAMEDKPRYHINDKVIYLREVHHSGNEEFSTVSEFNKYIEQQPAIMKETAEPPKEDPRPAIAIINTGLSGRAKVAIASIGAFSSIAIAAISALITYYSSKC